MWYCACERGGGGPRADGRRGGRGGRRTGRLAGGGGHSAAGGGGWQHTSSITSCSDLIWLCGADLRRGAAGRDAEGGACGRPRARRAHHASRFLFPFFFLEARLEAPSTCRLAVVVTGSATGGLGARHGARAPPSRRQRTHPPAGRTRRRPLPRRAGRASCRPRARRAASAQSACASPRRRRGRARRPCAHAWSGARAPPYTADPPGAYSQNKKPRASEGAAIE